MRRTLTTLAAAAVVVAAPSAAGAQVGLGYSDVAVVIGLGNIGDASASFGGRFEHVFKRLPDLGNGLLGFEASADVYTSKLSQNRSIRYIPVGATLNYHFRLDPSNKLDLFLGGGLGFNSVSCSNFGNFDCGSTSALYVIGRAGGRYFLKPNLAFYGDLGAGAATVNLGLAFKLK